MLIARVSNPFPSLYYLCPDQIPRRTKFTVTAQTSYIVFVWVQMHLWLPKNVVACEFHRHWRFVYIVECHLLSLHLFRLRPQLHLKSCNRMLELSWLSILSYWPSSYRYWLCRVPLTALLSRTTYAQNCWPVTVTWWLLGFFADLSQRCAVVHWWPLLPTVVCVCIM